MSCTIGSFTRSWIGVGGTCWFFRLPARGFEPLTSSSAANEPSLVVIGLSGLPDQRLPPRPPTATGNLDEHLMKKFIHSSHSSFVLLMLFTKKSDEEL